MTDQHIKAIIFRDKVNEFANSLIVLKLIIFVVYVGLERGF